MPNPLILVYDMGTQSARAMLVDKAGNILGKAQKKYEEPYFSPEPGWAEQKPSFYWEALCECSRKLKTMLPDRWGDIIALTCTTIRDTCLCLDATRQPLRNCILWLDGRESSNESLPAVNKLLYALVGKTETVKLQRRVSACNWIAEHEPELWAKTDKFVLLSCWLNYMICGNLRDAAASTIGHLPFSNKARTWMKPNDLIRPLFDIRDSQTYELAESGEVLGTVTAAAAKLLEVPEGLPLIASGSDKACETIGLGCIHEGSAALGFSTTATVEVTTSRYVEPYPLVPPYVSILPGHWTPEVEIYRGYWLVSWFKREFARYEAAEAEREGISTEELLNRQLSSIPAGCLGLILQPYFNPGLVMPHARGAALGFTSAHTRMHFYRAIIEGINFGLMEGLYSIEQRSKSKVHRLMIAGGGSQSAEICQITANMFGLPLQRIHTHEATGLGAALTAFVGMGEFADYDAAIAAMVRPAEAFQPDAAQHKIYQRLYTEVFAKAFDRLQPLYTALDLMK
ncbi:MAG: FGGY-family carbohydrate kinase [Oscillospiraceae bacterium]|jgi:sugar (pentulose or hexulose) kinase|nr:FGGY-family carbohydrate kinase [Oscillospiraceae bacterium]